MQRDLLQYLSPTPRLRCPASPWYRLTNLILFSMCELGIEKFWIWNWWLLSRYLSSRKADFKTCTGRRMVVVLVQASRTLFASGTNLCYQNTKLQDPRSRRLQHRHPAGFLRHRQAWVGSELMVRGVQPAAILPLRALLQPEGHPDRPVQQVLLGCLARLLTRCLFSPAPSHSVDRLESLYCA